MMRLNPGDEYPVVILSNRDEAYDRPSGDWDWRGEQGRIFAPTDLQAGGTWIGFNDRGVAAALTNIFPSGESGEFRSRGALVMSMLQLDRATETSKAMEQMLGEGSYNHFNLLVADARSAYLYSWADEQLDAFELLPGVYQVNNVPYRGSDMANPGIDNEQWLAKESWRLTKHPDVCRHGEGYGTCCSHKLLVHGSKPRQSRVWHLEGHPCEGEYQVVLGAKENS
ncbi:NRDE family protein [Candidatus Neomarinimicrobiota bacterium]